MDDYDDEEEEVYEELMDREIDDESKIVNDFYVDRPVSITFAILPMFPIANSRAQIATTWY